MKRYMYDLLNEKGIDVNEIIEVGQDDFFGPMLIQIDDIVKFILASDRDTQKKIRNRFVAIDFVNGDVMDFLKYIGRYMFKVAM